MKCPRCKEEMKTQEFQFHIDHIVYDFYWICNSCHIKSNYPSCFAFDKKKKCYGYLPTMSEWFLITNLPRKAFIFR